MFRHQIVDGDNYAGATFANTTWNITISGANVTNLVFVNDGSGATDAATAANATSRGSEDHD